MLSDDCVTPAAQSAPPARPSILIVDDDRLIVRSLKRLLTQMQYRVAGIASSGDEAVEKAMSLQPDLILMDIDLGAGIDGVQAAKLVRKCSITPVVFLVAHADQATRARAKVTGPFGCVAKPYAARDLQTAIEIGIYKHQVERQLRESEQWLATTLGSISDGVITTDAAGRVRFLNPLAERLTGWSAAEALGTHVEEVLTIVRAPSREPVPNAALQSLATGDAVTSTEDRLLISRTGAEVAIDDSASPMRDAEGTTIGAVLVFRDMTERRSLEEHLRQAQKMEAIGRLAGGIAHDFNNIMTIIIGAGELLLDERIKAAERPELIRQILGASERAEALTKQIMAFSRKQMLAPTVLHLNAVIREMADMVQRLIGTNIELVTDLRDDLGRIRVDPAQLSQVILNLAANARDAMAGMPGARLVIATRNGILTEQVCRLHQDVTPGPCVVLAVTDTGRGMPVSMLSTIFEPFFTTKGVGQGTGLGLSTVHGIIKQSGGHIEVASSCDTGTTFQIFLPLVAGQLPQPARAEAHAIREGRRTILLVDDEDALRTMTSTMLRRQGYDVLVAADGIAALELAAQTTGQIDLLLTDVMMPRLSGRELAEQMAALRSGMRVLFMSAYTEDTFIQQQFRASATNFLSKPFTLTTLVAKVREVLDTEAR